MSHVKKAANFFSGLGNDICSPFFNNEGVLHAIFQSSGLVKTILPEPAIAYNTGGQPSGAVFSSDGVLYLADFGHSGILAVHSDNQQEIVVGVYEDKPLKGPSSVNISNGDIFFTDSGSFGETGLHAPNGSLFTISNSPSGQILKPISLNNLAYPSAVIVSHDGKFIYVAEMMMNRIIRYFQQPSGVFHGSVFHQLAGGVGPSSLAIDGNGFIYVGQYDTKESADEGVVIVLNPNGKLQSQIIIGGPEISGLTIYDEVLYITEKSTGSIFKFNL
eukprot:gene10071-13533_t